MQKLQATILLSSPSHIMHLYEKAKELKIDVKKLPMSVAMQKMVNLISTVPDFEL